MPAPNNTFIRTQQLSTFITICFIISGIALNIRNTSWVDFTMRYASRNQAECGNEYLIIDTPNYAIYEMLKERKALVSQIMNSFILIQVAWYVVITSIVLLTFFDFTIINHLNVSETLIELIKKGDIHKIFTLLFPLLILIGYAIYIGISIAGFKKIISDMQTADISDLNSITNNKNVLFKQYVPSVVFFAPIILLFVLTCNSKYADEIDVSKYFIYPVLYVLIILISLKLNKSVLNLLYQVYNTYIPNVTDSNNGLETIIEKMLIDPKGVYQITDAPPPAPFTTYQNQLKHYIMQNIKSHEIVDGDAFILHDYKGNYWKYLLNQNGKELNELLLTYPNDSVLTGNIQSIRRTMRTLRNNTSIKEAIDAYSTETMRYGLMIIILILFALFHFVYKHLQRPITASLVTASIVFLCVILGPIYGWIKYVSNRT
jgi:hypothetical protein